ncbi:MAG: SEC-C domain-containing protein [Deltaproteobacteria bacterium]|nr:SEC-C domain-containing protein [Deltaproteobacteria bacterium]
MDKIFDGKRPTKLGTEKRPAKVRIKTKTRQEEVESIFKKNKWYYAIEVDAKKEEDVNDLEILLNTPKPVKSDKKVGRNNPCPCGSGEKHKKCCGK